MSQRFTDLIGLILLAAGLIYLATINFAHGHDHDRPGLDSWYSSLKSNHGGPCCDGPGKDATHLADNDWETNDGHYRVRVDGEWLDVPDDAVIKEPNKDGRTLVWLWYHDGKRAVRCFLPGAMT